MRKSGDNPLGGLFDFGHDGKASFGELFLARQIFEDCTRQEPEPEPDDFWRLCCEDGSDYGVFPELFDSEEEYAEALAAAKEFNRLFGK